MRILIVEDKNENIEVARAMLAGHDLTIATGFDQALDFVAARFDQYEAQNKANADLSGTGWGRLYLDWEDSEGKRGTIEGATGRISLTDAPVNIREIVETACEPFRPKEFDAVLTDVMYPKGGDRCMSLEGNEIAREQGAMPYGPIVALIALQRGVKKIGIVTQGNHHSDPFVFAFDFLHGFELGEAKVVASNCHSGGPYMDRETGKFVKYPSSNQESGYREFMERCEAGLLVEVKDWKDLLDRLMSEENIPS